jgi:cholesterol transport system auxiliary component
MRVLMAILMCALLSGCGMLSPVKVRTLSTYNLSMPNETSKIEKSYSLTADKNKKSSKVLLLATMSADPGYSSDRMIYVTREHELQAYAHHAWVAPPAQMILPMMADALRQQNYFHAVEMAPYPGTSQEILELRLIYLKQTVADDQADSLVECSIQASLLDSLSHAVIGTKVFTAHIKTGPVDAYNGVKAANAVVAEIAKNVSQYVVKQSEPIV